MGSLAAICSTLVVTILLVVVSQKNSGSMDASLRLQRDDSVSNKRKPVCPGPVLKPSDREEPWNRKFSEKLTEEVVSKDADKVQHPHLATKYFSVLHYTDTVPVPGLRACVLWR